MLCVHEDKTDHKEAPVLATQNTFVKVDGVPLLVTGDSVVPHTISGELHIGTVTGTAFIKIDGKNAVQIGDMVTCGAKMVTASAFINAI